jgi:hypothetical protein
MRFACVKLLGVLRLRQPIRKEWAASAQDDIFTVARSLAQP